MTKPAKTASASTPRTLSSRPPKAVKLRSAEGYTSRIPGLEARKAPKVTEAKVSGVMRDLKTRAK